MQRFCPICEELMRPVGQGRMQCNGCGREGLAYECAKEPVVHQCGLPYVSIDIETTGLDPNTDEVLEVAAVIDDWKRPIEELPVFRRILEYKTVTGSPFALAMNSELLRKIANPTDDPVFCRPVDFSKQFAEWLQSHGVDSEHVQAAGKNFASFDMQFLNRLPFFKHHIVFRHRVIDPAILYWLAGDERLPDSKTCNERSGFGSTVAHTAVEDAKAVVWHIRQGVKRLKGWKNSQCCFVVSA